MRDEAKQSWASQWLAAEEHDRAQRPPCKYLFVDLENLAFLADSLQHLSFACKRSRTDMGGPQDSGARNVLILLRIEGVGCSQNKF